MEKEKKKYESKTKNINNMLHKDQGIQYNPQLKSIFILPHGLPHAWFSFLCVNNINILHTHLICGWLLYQLQALFMEKVGGWERTKLYIRMRSTPQHYIQL